MALGYRVFLHSYLGFQSTSTLFYGEKDAILIDPPQLLSDAHRLVAEIILSGKRLTHVYASHFHPDHYFTMGVFEQAFPQAHTVALPSVVRDIAYSVADKLGTWTDERFGPDTVRKPLIPLPLAESRLELEGEEIIFSDDWEGDSINNTVVWVPALQVLCATDVAFEDWNVWFIESNVERRRKWRAALDKLKEFGARVVIPGHCSARILGLLERAARDPSLSYDSCLDWTRDYIDFYDEVYESAHSASDFVARIRKRYPTVKGNDFAVEWQARLLFPESSPDWFAPLPGEPGKIFLNPFGCYDGDPPRERKGVHGND